MVVVLVTIEIKLVRLVLVERHQAVKLVQMETTETLVGQLALALMLPVVELVEPLEPIVEILVALVHRKELVGVVVGSLALA